MAVNEPRPSGSPRPAGRWRRPRCGRSAPRTARGSRPWPSHGTSRWARLLRQPGERPRRERDGGDRGRDERQSDARAHPIYLPDGWTCVNGNAQTTRRLGANRAGRPSPGRVPVSGVTARRWVAGPRPRRGDRCPDCSARGGGRRARGDGRPQGGLGRSRRRLGAAAVRRGGRGLAAGLWRRARPGGVRRGGSSVGRWRPAACAGRVVGFGPPVGLRRPARRRRRRGPWDGCRPATARALRRDFACCAAAGAVVGSDAAVRQRQAGSDGTGPVAGSPRPAPGASAPGSVGRHATLSGVPAERRRAWLVSPRSAHVRRKAARRSPAAPAGLSA